MKVLGQLLIWGSLGVGALAAATAYLASLDEPDERLVGLTLAAPAGETVATEDAPEPIARSGEQITPETLASLRAAGIRNVRVNEFSFARWRGRWYFLSALGGLALGAWLSRSSPAGPRGAGREAARAASPKDTLEAVQTAIDRLRDQLPGLPDDASRLETVVAQIGHLQKTHMEAFVEARPAVIASLGLAGFAAVMSSYAAAERQINRAWSAAVDRVLDEALACLDEASARLGDARQTLC
jgi:hypothetical protein